MSKIDEYLKDEHIKAAEDFDKGDETQGKEDDRHLYDMLKRIHEVLHSNAPESKKEEEVQEVKNETKGELREENKEGDK